MALATLASAIAYPIPVSASLLFQRGGYERLAQLLTVLKSSTFTTAAALAFQASCGSAPYPAYPPQWEWDPAKIVSTQPQSATDAMGLTPKVEQYRGGTWVNGNLVGGTLIATYNHLSGTYQTCNVPGRSNDPSLGAGPTTPPTQAGCEGPFNTFKYPAWQAGDTFLVYPAVYKEAVPLGPPVSWSGTVTFTNDSNIATVAANQDIGVNDWINDTSGTYLPYGTHVTAIDSTTTQITMDQPAQADGSVSLSFLRKVDGITIQGVTQNVGGVPTRPTIQYDQYFNADQSLAKGIVYIYGDAGAGEISNFTWRNIDVVVIKPPAGQQYYYVANDPFANFYLSGTQLSGNFLFEDFRSIGATWIGSGGSMGFFSALSSTVRANTEVLKLNRAELYNNGGQIGPAHNLYINEGNYSFWLTNSFSHTVNNGHLIKSRAVDNHIIGNFLWDGGLIDGTNYGNSNALDLPCGGNATVIGNIMTRRYTDKSNNPYVFAYQEGSCKSYNYSADIIGKNLTLRNNTFIALAQGLAGDHSSQQSSANIPILINGISDPTNPNYLSPGNIAVLPGDFGWPIGSYDFSNNLFVGFCPGQSTGARIVNFPWYGTQPADSGGVTGPQLVADFSEIDEAYSPKTNYAPQGDTSIVGAAEYTHKADAGATRALATFGAQDATASGTATPAAKPAMLFMADAYMIPAGTSTLLHWQGTGANTCTGTGFDTGGAVTNWGTGSGVTVTPIGDTTYTLTCTGPSGTSTDSVTVHPIAPPTATLTPSATTVSAGTPVFMSWGSTNAETCSKGNGWANLTVANHTAGTVASSTIGDKVSPTQTTTYSLVCDGTNGESARASATVTVTGTTELPTVWLRADALKPANGVSTTLTWGSSGATSCTGTGNTSAGTPWDTGGATSGTATFLAPQFGSVIAGKAVSTTYGIICTGPGGTSPSNVAPTVKVTPQA